MHESSLTDASTIFTGTYMILIIFLGVISLLMVVSNPATAAKYPFIGLAALASIVVLIVAGVQSCIGD